MATVVLGRDGGRRVGDLGQQCRGVGELDMKALAGGAMACNKRCWGSGVGGGRMGIGIAGVGSFCMSCAVVGSGVGFVSVGAGVGSLAARGSVSCVGPAGVGVGETFSTFNHWPTTTFKLAMVSRAKGLADGQMHPDVRHDADESWQSRRRWPFAPAPCRRQPTCTPPSSRWPGGEAVRAGGGAIRTCRARSPPGQFACCRRHRGPPVGPPPSACKSAGLPVGESVGDRHVGRLRCGRGLGCCSLAGVCWPVGRH